MSSLREYLQINRDKIACTACGNCCPRTCKHFDGKICDIHPAGKAGKEIRDPRCDLSTPASVVLSWGVACKPVEEIITKLTGQEIPRQEKNKRFFNFKALSQVLDENVG